MVKLSESTFCYAGLVMSCMSEPEHVVLLRCQRDDASALSQYLHTEKEMYDRNENVS